MSVVCKKTDSLAANGWTRCISSVYVQGRFGPGSTSWYPWSSPKQQNSGMFGAWIVRQQEFNPRWHVIIKRKIHGDNLRSVEPLEDFHANDVTTSQIIKNVASDLPPWSHWTKATTHSTISNLENVVWECNLAASVFCFLLLELSHYQNLYVWTPTYVYKKFSGNRLP